MSENTQKHLQFRIFLHAYVNEVRIAFKNQWQYTNGSDGEVD